MANFLLRAGAVAVVACALAVLRFGLPDSNARTDRPLCDHCNVVLISFDTVRADHLGYAGYSRPTSPNVDALAARSVVFSNAVSQAPWTLPSHGAMLSGLYPSRLGVLHYPATRALPDVNTVLPEVFRAAGYSTAGFTGGGFVSDHYGFDRGFEVYSSKGRRFEHNLDDTLAWVEEHRAGPFFLFVHGYDAHRPYYSKDEDKAAMQLPANLPSERTDYCLRETRERPDDAGLDRIVRYYDAAIHHGDRAIGVFLEGLRKLGLEKNTVILLTSDHGEEFFEHGNCDHVRALYNESLQVPLMIHVPGYPANGTRIGGLVPSSLSVSRTLLDVVGIQHAMPGVTLLPLIEGKQRSFPVVYSEADSPVGNMGSRGHSIAMTKADAKLISFLDEGSDEAYDRVRDPAEATPLPETHPAYFLRQTLRAWSDSLRPLPRPQRAGGDGGEEGGDEESGADGGGAGRVGGAGAPGGAGAGASGASAPGATAAGKELPRGTRVAGTESRPAGAGAQQPAAASRDAATPANGAAAPTGAGKAERPARKKPEQDAIPGKLKEELKSLGYLE